MATEVLLMMDVPDLGVEGDVVQVAEGYARNYLLPKQLAAPVSEATRRRLAKLQADRAVAREASIASAKALAERLEGISCTIPVKTGEDGKLYGSVTPSDIADAVQQQGIELDRHWIDLEHPIKDLGVFPIQVKIDPEVTATLKVWVVEE